VIDAHDFKTLAAFGDEVGRPSDTSFTTVMISAVASK